MEGTSCFVDVGVKGDGTPRRLHYLSRGRTEADAPVLVAVHGLTRNCHDFDQVGERLAKRFRVLQVDVAGRKGSDWLEDGSKYGYPQYVEDAAAFCKALQLTKVAWLGTSMGGLIGMMMCAVVPGLIDVLILNDIGPFITAKSLEPLKAYTGKPAFFQDEKEAEAYFREIHAPFGPLTDAEWQYLTKHSVREARTADEQARGKLTLHYDPAIAANFGAVTEDIDMWPLWDTCSLVRRCLIIHGANSELLSAETCQKMVVRKGPQASEVVHIPACGHAPALMADDQIDIIDEWLKKVLPDVQ